MNPHKKPGVAFWATVVVVVALLAYPLSFGPACWIADRENISRYELWPYVLLIRHSPDLVFGWLERYADCLDAASLPRGEPPRLHIELFVMRHRSPD